MGKSKDAGIDGEHALFDRLDSIPKNASEISSSYR